jgi:hypothetical protein
MGKEWRAIPDETGHCWQETLYRIFGEPKEPSASAGGLLANYLISDAK